MLLPIAKPSSLQFYIPTNRKPEFRRCRKGIFERNRLNTNVKTSLVKKFGKDSNYFIFDSIHSWPMFSFYSLWKHQIVFGGCKMGTLATNRSRLNLIKFVSSACLTYLKYQYCIFFKCACSDVYQHFFLEAKNLVFDSICLKRF